MTKRFSALAVSAAVVGGFFITSVPAQAAPSAGQGVVSVKTPVTCDPGRTRQQIADLRNKAERLERLGETAAAQKALADAAVLQKRLDACIKADAEVSRPFPG